MLKKRYFVALLCFCVLFLFGCSNNTAAVATTETATEAIATEADTYLKSDTSIETESESGDATDSESVEMSETEAETESEPKEAVVKKFTDIHLLDEKSTYVARGKKLFHFTSSDPNYYIVQGGCFYGGRYYMAVIKKLPDGYEKTRILVIDEDGKVIKESEELLLDHANSITYNEKLEKLVVAHCQSPDGHYYRYSMVDPNTLTVTLTADKEYPFFAMAYSAERDMYASGEWGGETLDIWDGEMNHLKSVSVKKPGSLSQGVFCDREGIYFVRSSQNGHPAEIRIYSWKCKLRATVELKMSNGFEPESISIENETVYVAGTDWNTGRGVVYSLIFELVED